MRAELHPLARAVAADLHASTGDFVISQKMRARVLHAMQRASGAEDLAISLLALAHRLLHEPAAQRAVQQIIDLISPVLAKTINTASKGKPPSVGLRRRN